jgi:DNA repair exonuclease SbcCD ATPase subunit
MSEKLEFELSVSKNTLNAALDDAERKATRLDVAIGAALGSFAGNLATKAFDALAGGISNVIDFALASVDAAAAQEDAINRLAQSLRAAGQASEATVADFVNFANTLEQTSKQSDDAIIAQLAYAKSLGASNNQAKETIKAAAELSATFGGSLEQNVQLLGKALSGNLARGLSLIVPELKSLTAEQLRAGEAAKFVNERFGGAAAAELNTYSGRVKLLGDAYEDLQKQIGGLILGSSELGEGQSKIVKIINELTNAIADARVERARENGTLKESQNSIDQLQRQYDVLAEKQKVLNEVILKDGNFFDYLTNAPAKAAANLQTLKAEMDVIQQQIQKAKDTVAQGATGVDNDKKGTASGDGADVAAVENRKKQQAEIMNLKAQFAAEEKNFDLTEQNLKLTDEEARHQAELERIQAYELEKIELQAALKSQQAEAELSGRDLELANEKILQEKKLAQQAIFNKTKLDNAKKQAEAEKALERAKQEALGGLAVKGLSTLAQFAKDGSKEQFAIQKAAALAEIAVADAKSRALIPAQTATIPYPANLAAIAQMNALVTATTALGVAGVVASAIKGYADGGIVGASQGGDNRVATVRDGEMVLNADQQNNLFNAIKSGSLGGQPIIIQISGREIARAVRDEVNAGFKLV